MNRCVARLLLPWLAIVASPLVAQAPAPATTLEALTGEIEAATAERRWAEAILLGQRALAIEEAAKGANDPEIAGTLMLIAGWMRERTTAAWVTTLTAAGVPAGPVRDIPAAFADPQAVARQMRVTVPMPRAAGGTADLIGSPIKASRTPGRIERPPPALGEHQHEVLRDWLGLDDAAVAALGGRGAFGRV